MHGKQLIHTAVAVALLGLPSAALAQQQPSQWDRDGRAAQQTDRHDRRRDDRRYDDRRDRDDRRNADGRRDWYDRRDTDDRRDADDRRDRDRGNDGRFYGGNERNNRSGRLNGEVSSFGGFNMTLRNGQQVRLHQGTIINPTGTTLAPGMRLAISGHTNPDGSYEADRIDVLNQNGRY